MAGNPRAGNHVTTEANQSLWVTASTDRLLFYCLQKNGMLLQSESDWNTQNTFCFCLSRAHRRFWGCYGWTDQCSNAKLEHFDFPLEFWRSISNIVQQLSSWQSSVPPVLRFFSRDEEPSKPVIQFPLKTGHFPLWSLMFSLWLLYLTSLLLHPSDLPPPNLRDSEQQIRSGYFYWLWTTQCSVKSDYFNLMRLNHAIPTSSIE